ncbi:MAG: ACT domain-containing protein [Pseudomonadota bacterium]
MAERDLETLLKTLKVKQHDDVWRFETIPAENSSWAELISLRTVSDIAMLFREDEGLSLITKVLSDTPEDNRWIWLELSVYSDLQAVGFLAAVSQALMQAGIPCNAVAAYHHDHIFVPEGQAGSAIAALEQLANKA